jgi:hypothetical protein
VYCKPGECFSAYVAGELGCLSGLLALIVETGELAAVASIVLAS